MPTGKKEKTPKKKGAEQSYWIKSEKDDDIFIPRMYLDQQIEVNSIPRVLTRQSTLIVATCFVEKASARELQFACQHTHTESCMASIFVIG